MLSIIIPTFNSEKTIEATLTSITLQTFTDFEVLIIDGKSNDNTAHKVSKFLATDHRIKWVSEPDKGIYDAMNKGLKLSKGEWVYFLGSDDEFYNEEVLKAVFSKWYINSFDVVYGDVFSQRFGGLYDGSFTAEKLLDKNICHQAIFFKKKIFNKIGKFNLKYKAHADWDHNMKWFFSKRIKSVYLDEVVAQYGDGGFSSMNGDRTFANERVVNYLDYSSNYLPKKIRFDLLKEEYRRLRTGKNRRLLLKLICKTPKILIGA